MWMFRETRPQRGPWYQKLKSFRDCKISTRKSFWSYHHTEEVKGFSMCFPGGAQPSKGLRVSNTKVGWCLFRLQWSPRGGLQEISPKCPKSVKGSLGRTKSINQSNFACGTDRSTIKLMLEKNLMLFPASLYVLALKNTFAKKCKKNRTNLEKVLTKWITPFADVFCHF